MLKSSLLLTCFLVNGCAAIATVGGGSITTIQTAQTVDIVTTAGSAASTVTTGKSFTDHAISKIVGKDCRMFNVLNKKKFCRETKVYEAPKGTSEQNHNGLINTYLITEEKVNELKLGTRHSRYAHKIRGKGSHIKAECKSSGRISRVQDKISARRTGRDEACVKDRKSRRDR